MRLSCRTFDETAPDGTRSGGTGELRPIFCYGQANGSLASIRSGA
jgi:hypothetical protein